MRQNKKEFYGVLGALSIYSAKRKDYTEAKNKLLNNAKIFYKGIEKIIGRFKNGIFPLNYDEEEEQTRYEEEENNIRNENSFIDYERLERLIDLKNKGVNDELFRKYFQIQDLGGLLEKLKKSKNNTERNEIQIALIKSELRDLKKETEDMSEQEEKTENLNEIRVLVKTFMSLIDKNRDKD